MSKKSKAVISMLLSWVLALSFVALGAVAVQARDVACGSCGENYDNGFCACGYEAPALNGDGYYEIGNAGQLYWFAAQVNGGRVDISAKLTADITINQDLLNRLTFDGGSVTNGDDFLVWIPIGYSGVPGECIRFSGSFDGNGHSISGLYFQDPFCSYAGLFCYVEERGSIKSLGILDSYIRGGDYTGSLGGAVFCPVTDCYHAGTVIGGKNTGGLIGYAGGSITDCYNLGTATGGECVGGLVGYNKGAIQDCRNLGAVSGTDNVGGIAGCNYNNTVANCYNSGTVTGSAACAGGIAGKNYGYQKGKAILEGCGNEGSIYAEGNCAGGIVGMNCSYYGGSAATVRFCYNIGTVSGGTGRIGGIAGMNHGEMNSNTALENCYNTGAVSGAGIVAYNNNGTVGSCYYLGEETAEGVAGAYEPRPLEAFVSGQVAYLLGSPFGQNIDNGGENRGRPAIGGTPVYAADVFTCSGERMEGDGLQERYSNYPDATVVVHSDERGSCTICGVENLDYVPILRLAGDDRFETAFLAADRMKEALGVEKFDTVIIASGTNFADALSGSYLACVRSAPILLGFNEAYNAKAVEYIKGNLKPGGTVYILGGTAAVSGEIDTVLPGYNVKRLAGSNRFETNLLILKEAGVAAGQEILVCTGTNFADSLSASAVGKPILLVWNESGALTDSQAAYLAGLGGNPFCIIGGERAVGRELEAAVGTYGHVTRLAGADRFVTSTLVAERYFDDPASVVLAYAWNYPDGLCGGALACAMDAPLILTMTDYETGAAAYVQGHGIKTGVVLGGTGLISEASVQTVFGTADRDAGDGSAVGDYIGSVTSRKVHTSDCGSLPGEENRIWFETYEEAIAAGYLPCGSCLG